MKTEIADIGYNEYGVWGTVRVKGHPWEVNFYRPQSPSKIGEDLDEGFEIRLDVGDDANARLDEWLLSMGMSMSDLEFDRDDAAEVEIALASHEGIVRNGVAQG